MIEFLAFLVCVVLIVMFWDIFKYVLAVAVSIAILAFVGLSFAQKTWNDQVKPAVQELQERPLTYEEKHRADCIRLVTDPDRQRECLAIHPEPQVTSR